MKKYQIIYADPPWKYHMGKDVGKWLQNTADSHYSCMENEEIYSLPIQEIADKNCILFLWATFPKLSEALETIKRWGFEYKTIGFVWLKTTNKGKIRTDGVGWYTTSNAEICLIGKKGKLKRQKTGISQLIYFPRVKHSKKPPEVRTKIVELMGNLPRIELFARKENGELFEDKSFEGWDVWGNEVKSDIDLT